MIDFGTPKPCNTLKIDILTVPSARLDNLKIQYSANGTNWTDVSSLTRTGQVWKFTEVSARYWRSFLSGEGNATVVVTSSGMTGSPVTLSVPVESSDTADIVADKIKVAIENNENITALYDVSISDTDVILTAKAPASNVSNLNIALSNGTCAGLTAVSTSANTIAGVATVKQQEHIYVTGTIGTAGNAAVVVTAEGLANSPITLSVPVASGDSSTTVAAKVNAALEENADITDFFTISSANGRYVRLTAKTAADNDTTRNISIANDTCTGLTAIPTSTVDYVGNPGTKQVETLTVAGRVSYNWSYSLYYQSLPQGTGKVSERPSFFGQDRAGTKVYRTSRGWCSDNRQFCYRVSLQDREQSAEIYLLDSASKGGEPMQLTFEYTLDAGAGLFPQVIHTSDNLLRFIYLTSYGTVESVTADPVLGLYGDLTYEEISRISPDETVAYKG